MSEKSFVKTVLVQQCSLLAAEIFFVDSESKTFFQLELFYIKITGSEGYSHKR
jgi:hypothetical protein